ncbi:LOW QUALITY PROTEIN: hypothetical protein TorRG33x02_314980 [Trema orientale]|uniref:Uncharacterized protein n=1 Tax=Trema orientale TaxID=63057 RepID=A0A2P5BNJ1_TREOI|nr:LOW QUALITY PROTEIN: hypothetical protein TorRG33x02_314980 [Trema orientale]
MFFPSGLNHGWLIRPPDPLTNFLSPVPFGWIKYNSKLPLPGLCRSDENAIHSPSGDQLHMVSVHGPAVRLWSPLFSPSMWSAS